PARLELDARPTRRGVEAARHSEVETRPRPAVELEPEVLAVAAHPSHTAAHKSATEARGRGTLEAEGVGGAGGRHGPAARGGLPGDAAGALDFGELGHRAEHTSGSRRILGPGRSGDPRSA